MPHPNVPPRRGEIYWVDFRQTARGAEQAGRRPVVVISANTSNQSLPVVTVAAITSKIKRWAHRVAVLLPAGRPLRLESQVMAFQVQTIDKSRLENYAGSLTAQQVRDLERALRTAWEL